VSFTDVRGTRRSAEVEAESLYEAAILGIRRLNQDPANRAGDRPRDRSTGIVDAAHNLVATDGAMARRGYDEAA
jgi:hypothetical protein